MACLRCQDDNPSRAKFCEESGAPLTRICANLGTQLFSAAETETELK
jgi:hypothetical protein